jgi:hypothetical protein
MSGARQERVKRTSGAADVVQAGNPKYGSHQRHYGEAILQPGLPAHVPGDRLQRLDEVLRRCRDHLVPRVLPPLVRLLRGGDVQECRWRCHEMPFSRNGTVLQRGLHDVCRRRIGQLSFKQLCHMHI